MILVFSTTAFSQGYLKANGKLIVNDNGPILLRGLNLGNWLVNEGYLMEMAPAADAPHEIKHKIEGLIGEKNTTIFLGEVILVKHHSYKLAHGNWK